MPVERASGILEKIQIKSVLIEMKGGTNILKLEVLKNSFIFVAQSWRHDNLFR